MKTTTQVYNIQLHPRFLILSWGESPTAAHEAVFFIRDVLGVPFIPLILSCNRFLAKCTGSRYTPLNTPGNSYAPLDLISSRLRLWASSFFRKSAVKQWRLSSRDSSRWIGSEVPRRRFFWICCRCIIVNFDSSIRTGNEVEIVWSRNLIIIGPTHPLRDPQSPGYTSSLSDGTPLQV